MARDKPPAGFDEKRLELASQSLSRKRARSAARAWPDLSRSLGMDFDRFQRIFVAPASVSVIRYSSGGAELLATNTESGDLAALRS